MYEKENEKVGKRKRKRVKQNEGRKVRNDMRLMKNVVTLRVSSEKWMIYKVKHLIVASNSSCMNFYKIYGRQK